MACMGPPRLPICSSGRCKVEQRRLEPAPPPRTRPAIANFLGLRALLSRPCAARSPQPDLMRVLATTMLRQAAATASTAMAHRRVGGSAGAQWLAARRHHWPAGAPVRARTMRVSAVASPVRGPGLGVSEPTVRPLAVPAPAPSVGLGQGLGALWQAYLHSLERSPLLTKVRIVSTAGRLAGGAPGRPGVTRQPSAFQNKLASPSRPSCRPRRVPPTRRPPRPLPA